MTHYKICASILTLVFQFQVGLLFAESAPQWIWSVKTDSPNNPHYFSKLVLLASVPKEAKIIFTCDNGSEVFINGKSVGRNLDWQKPVAADVKKLLKAGSNIIAARAQNAGGLAGFVL